MPLLFPLSLPRIIRPRIIVTVIEACYLSGKLAAIIYRCWRISFQRREPSLRFHFPHTFRIIVLLNLARLRFLLRLLIVRSCFSSLIRFNKISKVNCRMKMARMSNARSIELLFSRRFFPFFWRTRRNLICFDVRVVRLFGRDHGDTRLAGRTSGFAARTFTCLDRRSGTMAAAKQPVVTRDQIKDVIHPSLLSLSLTFFFRISFQRCHFLSTSRSLAEDIVKTCLETGTLDASFYALFPSTDPVRTMGVFCNLSTFDQFEEEIKGYFWFTSTGFFVISSWNVGGKFCRNWNHIRKLNGSIRISILTILFLSDTTQRHRFFYRI